MDRTRKWFWSCLLHHSKVPTGQLRAKQFAEWVVSVGDKGTLIKWLIKSRTHQYSSHVRMRNACLDASSTWAEAIDQLSPVSTAYGTDGEWSGVSLGWPRGFIVASWDGSTRVWMDTVLNFRTKEACVGYDHVKIVERHSNIASDCSELLFPMYFSKKKRNFLTKSWFNTN